MSAVHSIGENMQRERESTLLHILYTPDPELRQQQIEIKQQIAALGLEDAETIHALRGQCAVIGHVSSVIKSAAREVCYYCGARML